MDTWAKVCSSILVARLDVSACCITDLVGTRQIPSQPMSLPDPFSDISCGGWEISEEPGGRLSLWVVSLQGKVRLRHRNTLTELRRFTAQII